MTPAPSEIHQLVAVHLHALLHTYLRGSSVGRVIISPADVRPATVRAIDSNGLTIPLRSGTAWLRR